MKSAVALARPRTHDVLPPLLCSFIQTTGTFLRKARSTGDIFLVACNFTPVTRYNYRVGLPRDGFWKEMLNSDAPYYGGSGQGNFGGVEAAPFGLHGRPRSLTLTLPPLAALFFKSAGRDST